MPRRGFEASVRLLQDNYCVHSSTKWVESTRDRVDSFRNIAPRTSPKQSSSPRVLDLRFGNFYGFIGENKMMDISFFSPPDNLKWECTETPCIWSFQLKYEFSMRKRQRSCRKITDHDELIIGRELSDGSRSLKACSFEIIRKRRSIRNPVGSKCQTPDWPQHKVSLFWTYRAAKTTTTYQGVDKWRAGLGLASQQVSEIGGHRKSREMGRRSLRMWKKGMEISTTRRPMQFICSTRSGTEYSVGRRFLLSAHIHKTPRQWLGSEPT